MNPEARACALYRDTFGRAPLAVASAPGRVNLIGEHVDYHGGHVLPVATSERTACAVGPVAGLRAVSEQGVAVRAAWPPERLGLWSDYVVGVAAAMGPGTGPWSGGLAVAVASDVPLGAGVSSSAALEVAAAVALARWAGRPQLPRELAEIAFLSETEFVGMPCGRMDQMASALTPSGSALLLDCRTLEVCAVPVGVDIVLADSGERHVLRESAYAERRREGLEVLSMLRAHASEIRELVDIPPARLDTVTRALPVNLARRVRHVVEEDQRAIQAARALEQGDFAAFGALVNASHDSLRDLYECSTPRLDTIVEAARRIPGVLGARLVGAGWGGSVLVVCEPGKGRSVVALLAADRALALPAVRVVVPGAGAVASAA